MPNMPLGIPEIVVPTSTPSSPGYIPIPRRDDYSPHSLMPSPELLSVTPPTPYTPISSISGSLPDLNLLYAPHGTSPIGTPPSFLPPFPFPPFPPSTPITAGPVIPFPEPQPRRSRSNSHRSTTPRSQVSGRERVPQRFGVMYTGNPWKIEFSVNGAPGIRVQDAVDQSVELDSGGEEIFTSDGSRQIHLKIRVRCCRRTLLYVFTLMHLLSGQVTRKRAFMSVSGIAVVLSPVNVSPLS